MKVLKIVNQVLLRLLDVVSIILMVGMVIFLLIQLIARGIFNFGFAWTEESAKICLIMLAYVGAAMTSINGVHVNVTILNDLLHSEKGRKLLFILQQLIAMAFLVLVFIFSFPALEIASKSVTTNTHINNAILYSVIPISCVIMFLGHLSKIVRQCSSATFVEDVDLDRSEENTKDKGGNQA